MTVSTDHPRLSLQFPPLRLFIGGSWRPAADGATYNLVNPATGQALAEVASTGPPDVTAAMDAAAGAFPEWSATTLAHRVRILERAAQLVQARAGDLAALLSLEAGVPLACAQTEAGWALDGLWAAIRDLAHPRSGPHPPGGFGGMAQPPPGARAWTGPLSPGAAQPWPDAVGAGASAGQAGGGRPGRAGWLGPEPRWRRAARPIGPVLVVLPAEEPLVTAAKQTAAALAAGCPVILKPAAETPLAVLALTQTLIEAGLPAGVLNVIPCVNAPSPIEPTLGDPRLRKLSYTGSVATAQKLLAAADLTSLDVTLDLAGPAPLIVTARADRETALAAAQAAASRFNGQGPAASHVAYVDSSLAHDFADGLASRFSSLTVGDPAAGTVQVGPVLSAAARDAALAQVAAAVQGGASVLTGGSAPSGDGFFVAPTVLQGVAPETWPSAEVCGPVLGIVPFDSLDQAVDWANSARGGSVAYVIDADGRDAERIGARLSHKTVAVNTGVVPPLPSRHPSRDFARAQVMVLG
ncbi:MAG: aldehyde dehydrogenase family protein [Bifidobacteriaceae bacterium]|nr:aldehyde dehydrogenase family protein [Bifidobacteriaceae bacterium]